MSCARQMFEGQFLFQLTPDNEPVIRKMIQYFWQSPRFFEPGARAGDKWVKVTMSPPSLKKGICLIGNPGTGKDTIFMVFSHILKYYEYHSAFDLVNCQELAQRFQIRGIESIDMYGYGSFVKGPKGLIKTRPKHYCFRDLGAETDAAHFGNKISVMTEIIQARNDNIYTGMISHATTNMDVREVAMRYGSGLPPSGKDITPQMLESGGNKRLLRRFKQQFNRIILPGLGYEM